MENQRTSVYRRSAQGERRAVRRTLTVANAAEALGPIEPGIEMYALCKGDYSLIDIIEHCLDATGPADVTVSTWTAAGADLEFAMGFVVDGRVRSSRWLVDFSFPQRQPQYFALLVDRFGAENVRATATHAKFVLIRNEKWNVVLRTSMNLNMNRRLENVEISDDAGLADYLEAVVDELFASVSGDEVVKNTPYRNKRLIDGLGRVSDAGEVLSGFVGDGALDRDLRRVGVSWD
jgi:hypothetical protein